MHLKVLRFLACDLPWLFALDGVMADWGEFFPYVDVMFQHDSAENFLLD